MKIAVATHDWLTVSGHAGQSRRWLVFSIGEDGNPGEPERVDLPKEMVFHHFKDDRPHPLDGVAVIITQHAGEGFLNRMRKRGMEPVLTAESDAAKAVADYLAQHVVPPRNRPLLKMVCKVRDLFSEHR